MNIVFFAGLYRIEEIGGIGVPVFTILTTEAADEIRFIHERMPVMMTEDDAREWVGMNTSDTRATAMNAISGLLAQKSCLCYNRITKKGHQKYIGEKVAEE